MSFLTAGETEVRAWTIPIAQTAVKAAGAIHSDFEKKFIRAEVVNWKTLVDQNGYPGVREKGLLRLEGKEYIVKDGDVLVIRHGRKARRAAISAAAGTPREPVAEARVDGVGSFAVAEGQPSGQFLCSAAASAARGRRGRWRR